MCPLIERFHGGGLVVDAGYDDQWQRAANAYYLFKGVGSLAVGKVQVQEDQVVVAGFEQLLASGKRRSAVQGIARRFLL